MNLQSILQTLSPEARAKLIADAYVKAKRIAAEARQASVSDYDPIAWIESEFYIPELRGPIVLYPHQRAVLKEAYRKDERGKYIYDLVLWSDIKKSAKSVIAAAVILERALRTEWGSFKVVANDLKQADSRVFFYIRRAIELNPRLKARATIRNYKITLDNHATIEAIPVDPSGEAGGNDDLIEFTELHGMDGKAAFKMWTEMTLSPTKHGDSQRWIDTYAGNTGQAPILEPLYERCVKPEHQIDLGVPGLEVYAYGKMLALWNTQPRLPWQTPAYYASESVTLIESEFNRVHRNMWSSSQQKFVPDAWWDACKATIPVQDKYKEIIVGLDAAVSNDCFGIVGVSREGDMITERFVRCWIPPRGGKLEFSNPNDPDDVEYPEGEIRRLAREYNVIAFGYDSYQLHHLCSQLAAKNIGYFFEFKQGEDRLKADKRFYDVIRDRQFRHSGNSELTAHVKNADAKSENEKLRIVKRADHLKIDLAVAGSMATDLAYELLPG